MIARSVTAAFLVVTLLGGVGCWFRGPADVRREVSQLTDLKLDREFGIRVGRVGIFLARQGLRIAGEHQIPLKGVRRVAVGVYSVREPKVRPAYHTRSNSLCSVRWPGWELVVRVCDPDEHVLLLVKQEEESIRGLLVVVQSEEEVVIVSARGKLDRIIERVMELAGEEADLPGLWRRTPTGGQEEPLAPAPSHEEEVEPLILVCEADVDEPAEPEGDYCADRTEARERVLEVARVLSPDDNLLPASP